MSGLPDLTLAVYERVFPRTFLCLSESEKLWLAKQLAKEEQTDNLRLFVECLTRRKWERGRGFAPDLARLEFCLRLAALAPDVEKQGFESVAEAAEPDWYGARFRFDPGHRLLESDWPLAEVYAHPQEQHREKAGTFLIYRVSGKPQFRALQPNEALLIRSLGLGVPLGRVLDRNNGPDFDARTFQHWIESGLLRAIDWASVKILDGPGAARSP